jgi:hypothetical protein
MMCLGFAAWLAGNLVNDKAGGMNIGIALISAGAGLAKQEGSSVNSENVENLNIEQDEK